MNELKFLFRLFRPILKSVVAPTLFIILLLTGCSYPFAPLSDDEILPRNFAQVWQPPPKRIQRIKNLSYTEPVDPDTLKEALALNQVVDFSLTNNPNTALSWASVQAAIADLGLARQDYWPKVDISADVTRYRSDSPFSVQAFASRWLTAWGPQIDVNYTLWDFGARFARSEAALRALFAVAYSYNQELQTVIQSVTNDYYDNLYQKAVLKDRSLDVDDARLVLEAAEKKLNLGIVNVSDVLQAKTGYLSAQVQYVNQRDNAQNSFVKLATDMGMAPNTQFETQSFPCELPGNEYLAKVDDFIDVALSQRPDMIRAKAEVMSKKAALTEARLEPLPKIKGDLNLNWRDYSDGFGEHFDFTGMFKVNFPFFDGFYYRSKIRRAKAELRKAKATLKADQDQILSQVATYYNNYTNALERVSYTLSFLKSAMEEFKVTLSNYKAGTGDIIQVVQAQTALSDARSQYTNSVRDIFVSLTNLAYSTGSLVAPANNSSWDGIYQFAPEANNE